MSDTLAQKNRRFGLIIIAVVISMVGVAYAFVPLYNLFCRVTGFAGTTQVSEAAPDVVLDRTVSVKFNADTARDMPWEFNPGQREVTARLGEKKLVSYKAYNPSGEPITGTAVYNVTPAKAGKYFHKIACFCFGEQTLQPGEKVDMPVVFYVDPLMNDDPDMKDLTTITLSYSFFKIDSPDLDQALDDFYNQTE